MKLLLNKDNYNKLTGNLSNYLNPNLNIPIITINNNKFKNTYPIGDESNNKPSINGREIIIPLKLNFTKNVGRENLYFIFRLKTEFCQKFTKKDICGKKLLLFQQNC